MSLGRSGDSPDRSPRDPLGDLDQKLTLPGDSRSPMSSEKQSFRTKKIPLLTRMTQNRRILDIL